MKSLTGIIHADFYSQGNIYIINSIAVIKEITDRFYLWTIASCLAFPTSSRFRFKIIRLPGATGSNHRIPAESTRWVRFGDMPKRHSTKLAAQRDVGLREL